MSKRTCEKCGTEFSMLFPYQDCQFCVILETKVTEKSNHDPVNSPSHYTSGGIETIDYLKAKMSSEMFEGFLLGNVLKYTSRYRGKNGKQDLEKANWYLNKLIDLYPGDDAN